MECMMEAIAAEIVKEAAKESIKSLRGWVIRQRFGFKKIEAFGSSTSQSIN